MKTKDRVVRFRNHIEVVLFREPAGGPNGSIGEWTITAESPVIGFYELSGDGFKLRSGETPRQAAMRLLKCQARSEPQLRAAIVGTPSMWTVERHLRIQIRRKRRSAVVERLW